MTHNPIFSENCKGFAKVGFPTNCHIRLKKINGDFFRNLGMKIYTKTGDAGTTSLLGGSRVSKADLRIETYGTVDELNSHVGLLRSESLESESTELLLFIQDRLFTMGSHLALESGKNFQLPTLENEDIERLEKAMDRMNEVVPPMRHFILPGSNAAEAHAHIARCVCRRAERLLVALNDAESMPPILQIFLNRLSDYLFVYSRYITHQKGLEETPWIPKK
jgi:cob(I)alamin adenosyltransferase